MFRSHCLAFVAFLTLVACSGEREDDSASVEGAVNGAAGKPFGGTSLEERRRDFEAIDSAAPLGLYLSSNVGADVTEAITFELNMREGTKNHAGTMEYSLMVTVDKPGATRDLAFAVGEVSLEPATASDVHFMGSPVLRFEAFKTTVSTRAQKLAAAFLAAPYITALEKKDSGALKTIEFLKVDKLSHQQTGQKFRPFNDPPPAAPPQLPPS